MPDEIFNVWRITVDLHTDVLEAEAQTLLKTIQAMDMVAGADLEELDG